jgi:WD40 repeat protein/tetratricopeptide (TPR) repeat protein
MDTLDFELEIGDPAGQGYPVTARAPSGEAAASMRLPLTREELDYQLGVINDAVLASSAVARRVASGDEQPVQLFGRRLFDALLVDDVRALYVASAQRARDEGAGLRLVLRIRSPELARLPWEFLFDAGRQDYVGLSLPLVRYPQVLAPRQPLQAAAPLRILGMVARPGDQDALEVGDEQRRLRAALAGLERDGLVELVWVDGQAYSDLEDAMDHGPWHVFHFVGHGGYDPGSDEGTIALASEQGRTDAVGADDLSRLLGEHYTLRLVVLNACDTGRGSALDVFSSTAGALVRRGIPAVVAMQFAISDPAAIGFAQTFYQNVAKRLPVDAAVMRARRALRRAKKDTLEWGTPVLYLRAPDGRIFDTTGSPTPATAQHEEGPPQAGRPGEQAGAAEVEALYDQALAAIWTERWEQAVDLLREVLALRRDHPAATGKLEHARRQQQLAAGYAHARAAADAGEWEQAVAAYAAVADADPGYRDVRARLENARRLQQLTGLYDEARRLHQAREWAAVLKVGERIHALDPAAADPGGLITDARAELAQAHRAEQLATHYRTGLRLLDAGRWQQAVETLVLVSQHDPAYRDTAALLARARRELAASSPSQTGSSRLAMQPKAVQTVRLSKAVDAVTFSPDGRVLATGSDKTARIWHAATGHPGPTMTHEGRMAVVISLAFNPDGRQLATAGSDGTARIWVAAIGQELLKLIHGDWVRAVAFSPDGRALATASDDKTARIWDAASGQELVKLTHGDWVNGVAFSPDGRALATASRDKTARIWVAASGQELLKLTHGDWVNGVAFSPDGRALATASDDKTARIWDAASGQELLKLTHRDSVRAVAFSPDGRALATASDDKTARIWVAASGQELLKLTHSKSVRAVAFSPDGRALATGGNDKTARIWALEEGGHDG